MFSPNHEGWVVVEILTKDQRGNTHWHPMGVWTSLERACHGFRKNGFREVLYNMWEIVALRYHEYDSDSIWIFDDYHGKDRWSTIDQRTIRRIGRELVKVSK